MHRWEGNVRLNHKHIGVNAWDWVDSTQDRDYWRILVNMGENLGSISHGVTG